MKDQLKINAAQRVSRRANGNAYTKKYEKTKPGFLMRAYRNMLSRVKGIQVKKAHLYSGLEILEKAQFYDWAMRSKEFHKLWDEWEESGHDRKLCPSVDRKDSSLGYCLSNMEWVTHSVNSSRGALSRYGKV